jgi:hypothetical protein
MPGLLPGDVNGDGMVNGLDVNVIAMNWMMNVGSRAEGDLNGDGVVNGLDANEVSLNWNAPNPPASAIPEPSALVLAAIVAWGACGLFARRRRRA